MNSSLIGKIEKAKLYAQEPSRVTITQLAVTFRGDNDDHSVQLQDGRWHCTCDFFAERELCSHTMAMEKLLREMLPERVLASSMALR